MNTLIRKPYRVRVAVGRNSRQNSSTYYDPFLQVTSRLKDVIKRHNGGLLAYCPSHNDRKGRSLAISVGREGQVLMHCFAGCSIHEITGAIDLNPADLFPRTKALYEPQARHYLHDWQILNALRHDALVLLIAAKTILKGEKLAESDVEYLTAAVIRMHEAASYSRGARDE